MDYNRYKEIVERAMRCAEAARREGLLALEEEIERVENVVLKKRRNIFYYGMRFVIDGTDSVKIQKILDNLIKQEKNKEEQAYMEIEKEAVLGIQEGDNPRILYSTLNSLTPFSLEQDEKELTFLKKLI